MNPASAIGGSISELYAQLGLRNDSGHPALRVPHTYQEGEFGKWRLTIGRLPPLLRGYYNGLHAPADRYNPNLSKDERIWMSVSPMETESQYPMVQAAYGHVVVMGLGMGMVLFNLLQRAPVVRVTVIEKDPDVISGFRLFSGCRDWEHLEKATITQGNALSWTGSDVDVVLADIWPKLGDTRIERHMRVMRRNIPGAKRFMAWSQEFAYVSWGKKVGLEPDDLREEESAQRWSRHSGLYVPEGQNWGSNAVWAVENQLLA